MPKRLSGPFKDFGVGAGLIYCVHRILAKIGPDFGVFYYEVMAQPVMDKCVLPARLAAAFNVREIARDDPLVSQMPLTPDKLEYRYGQDAICLGVHQNEKFVGYMWLCPGPYEEDEVRCTFVPDAREGVWDFGMYVFPEHRFGPGFVALWDGANQYLRKSGYRYSFSRVSWFNVNSRKVHTYFKWRRIGLMLFLKLKSWQCMLSTLPPYIHISAGDGSKPAIRVSCPPEDGIAA